MSKYRASRTLYAGIWYDSKLEARAAQLLDTMRHAENPAERVEWVARQVCFTAPWGSRHYLDFIAGKADGSICFIEVKGRDVEPGKEKRKWLQWFLRERITVWRKDDLP